MEQPIQDSRLQEQIDWDAIMPMSRYAGGHDDQMQGLFKGAVVLAHWNEGDYQGVVATVVQLSDGRIAAYNDYYGSCSGCDSWESADDAAVRTMCIGLANEAHVFSSVPACVEWLKSIAGDAAHYDWREAAPALAVALEPLTPGSE